MLNILNFVWKKLTLFWQEGVDPPLPLIADMFATKSIFLRPPLVTLNKIMTDWLTYLQTDLVNLIA